MPRFASPVCCWQGGGPKRREMDEKQDQGRLFCILCCGTLCFTFVVIAHNGLDHFMLHIVACPVVHACFCDVFLCSISDLIIHLWYESQKEFNE